MEFVTATCTQHDLSYLMQKETKCGASEQNRSDGSALSNTPNATPLLPGSVFTDGFS